MSLPNPENRPPARAEDLLRAAFKYQAGLTSYAFALLQDWSLAQDAVQETFIVMQRKHADFENGGNLFAWARQILRFEALNILRNRKMELPIENEELFSLIDAQFQEHLTEAAAAEAEERKIALHFCMSRLNEAALVLLLGFYRDRLSCEELSRLQSKTVNAVRLSLSRLRAQLRECVRARLALLRLQT